MRNKEATSRKMLLLTRVKSALTISCFVLFASDCAIAKGSREIQNVRFEFALIGDMPYDGGQKKEFAHLMKEINLADLAFVVHNGDF
jgi:hypothetical protein